MKRVIVVMLMLCVISIAQANYIVEINGQNVAEYTMNVGDSVTVTVASDSLTPVQSGVTPWSDYLENNVNFTAWDLPNYTTNGGTLSNLVIDNAKAGWSCTGWANASPYDNIGCMGWSFGMIYGNPVETGVWWTWTYTANEETDVRLSLGYYDEFFTNYTVLQDVTIHQVPEPATICLLGLGGLLLKRRK